MKNEMSCMRNERVACMRNERVACMRNGSEDANKKYMNDSKQTMHTWNIWKKIVSGTWITHIINHPFQKWILIYLESEKIVRRIYK